MSLERVHVWLADRVRWVQYPRVQRTAAPETPGVGPIKTIGLLLYAVVAGTVGLMLVAVGSFVGYVIISSWFK